MSKSDVPQKLTNLWERYKLEQERAGKLVFKNSGFAGTGFKFDDAEKQMDKDRKKMQQAALGLNVSNNSRVMSHFFDESSMMTNLGFR